MTDVLTEHIQLPKVRGVYKFNEPLGRYTWLNVGGPADVMFFPKDEADLQTFMQNKNANLSVFVMGGGSNLLVRDRGISGVVIKLSDANFAKWRIEENTIYCGAGCTNFALKKVIAQHGLGGLEFLCSIPGTIGGAVRGNAGCFGQNMADVLSSVRGINGQGEVFETDVDASNFGYRCNNFPADWIVTEVGLRFERRDISVVQTQIAQNDEYRRLHQPQGIKTAGSTFKNPDGHAAWKLIKDAGADTLKFGNAKMSDKHCNFLQNEGECAADIEQLCKAVQQAVKQQSGIALEMEIKIIGRE